MAADPLRGRLVRGAGMAAAGYFLSRAITFGAYIAIAALISPVAAGQFAAGTVIVGMALLFAESGMLGAIIHWRGDVEEAASTAFASTVVTGVLLTLLGVAVSPLVGAFFDSATIGEVAAVSSGWLLLRSLQIVPEALLQRRFSFLRRVVIDPLGAIAFAVGAIVACAQGMGVWGLVLGTYALYAVQLVAAWGFVRWRPRRTSMSWGVWRQLAGYARHIVASEVLRRFTTQLDSIFLGRFVGAAPLGQYSYGMRLASQPSAAWISIAAYVLFPAFARIAEDAPRLRRAFADSLAAMATLAFPLSLILLPLGDDLVLLAFGPEWPLAGDAVKALCAAGIGWGAVSVASEVFKAVGRPQLITRVHAVSLASSLLLIPSLLFAEVVGVAIAVSLASLISGGYALRHAAASVGSPVRALLARLWGIAAAAAVALAVTGALDATVFADATTRWAAAGASAAEGLVMLAVYAAALRILAPAEARRAVEMAGQLRRRSRPAAASV
jgi:PST family polysaccharide transporter